MNASQLRYAGTAFLLIIMSGCTGIFDSVYDESPEAPATRAGQLYVDASDWGKWYSINLLDAESEWECRDIPTKESTETVEGSGIYTYWYDVFRAGISVNEFRSYTPAALQSEPKEWTIAVHRNNVRTNGCRVAATLYQSMDEIPSDKSFIHNLSFVADEWTENEVWCEQSKMLLGLIGCQGIAINRVLSTWLTIEIPPMPPAFSLNSDVFILELPDKTYAALQLENYQNPTGVKCCLSINYRYPL